MTDHVEQTPRAYVTVQATERSGQQWCHNCATDEIDEVLALLRSHHPDVTFEVKK